MQDEYAVQTTGLTRAFGNFRAVDGIDLAVPAGSFFGEVTVTGILPTGGSWILELRSENHTLLLTTHEFPRIDHGSNVHFWIKPEALHVFDTRGRRVMEADNLLHNPNYN